MKTSGSGLVGPIGLLIALSICLGSSSVLAAGAPPESATPEQKKQATAQFQAGSTAYQGGRFEEARTAFEASYGTVASPNSHLMLARTLAKLGRLGEAYAHFELTVQEAEAAAAKDPKYREAGETAKSELAELSSKVGMIEVRTLPAQAGGKLRIEGRELEMAAVSRPIAVTPGKVTVELVDGGTSEQRVVDVTAGASAIADFTPAMAQPAPAPPEPTTSAQVSTATTSKRTLAYIAGGVGIAGLVTFAIFGSMNNSKFNDLEEQCPNRVCPTKLEDDADTGQTYQTIANVGLFVGVIGLATGGVFYYLSGKENTPEASARRSTAPRIGLGPRGVTVSGRF